MQVTVHANVDVETEVHLSIDEITEALRDIECETNRTMIHPDATERNKVFAIGQFVTAAWQCLSAVTDDMIALLPAMTRAVIADALAKQAARFREPF